MYTLLVQCIIALSAFFSFGPIIFPTFFFPGFAWASHLLLTFCQIALTPFLFLGTYARFISWPKKPPTVWKKYARKMVILALLCLVIGCFYAKLCTPAFHLIISPLQAFSNFFFIPHTYLYFAYSSFSLIGVLYGLYHRKTKRRSKRLLFYHQKMLKFLLPTLTSGLCLSLIALSLTDTGESLSANVWEAIHYIFYIAIAYITLVILVCRKFAQISFKDLLLILFYPIFKIQQFFVPPTSHLIEPYLPQARNTSLILHYNFTMECLGGPCAVLPLLLCSTYTPSLWNIFLCTTLLILPRIFLAIPPLLSHAIGCLLLTAINTPLPYISLSVWVFALSDIIINLPQIFTSYIGLTFLIPIQERIGSPIKIFEKY